jgi:hypothetical protein
VTTKRSAHAVLFMDLARKAQNCLTLQVKCAALKQAGRLHGNCGRAWLLMIPCQYILVYVGTVVGHKLP